MRFHHDIHLNETRCKQTIFFPFNYFVLLKLCRRKKLQQQEMSNFRQNIYYIVEKSKEERQTSLTQKKSFFASIEIE